MGRAQVLYNRRKGRGRGGGRGNSGNRDGRNSNRNSNPGDTDNNTRRQKPHKPVRQQPVPTEPLLRHSDDRDYEEEYEVLFAGRHTYLESNNDSDNDDDDDQPSLLAGRICIPSMAATLEKLSIAERLRIPVRVAAKAFPSRYRSGDDDSAGDENTEFGADDRRNEEATAATTFAAIGSGAVGGKNTGSGDSPDDSVVDGDLGIDDASRRNVPERTGPAETRDASRPIAGAPTSEDPVAAPKSALGEAKQEATDATSDALARAAEEFDDDNLDDWLDSVI